jgi:hypothetical protein
MGANLKSVLLRTVYFTLIAVMVAFVVFFMITLSGASMASWERILYYILAIALVLVVVYDIICTFMHRQKYISGFILYAITLAVIILSLVVMALNSANGRLLIDITERFWRIIFFSYLINALAILIYCTGEKLITNVTNRSKK